MLTTRWSWPSRSGFRPEHISHKLSVSSATLRTARVSYSLILLLITQLTLPIVVGQSCAGIGQLCGRSTDCCRGCCDSYQCVDRTYCPNDLGGALGGLGGLSAGGACQAFYCPPGQMCVLTQACIPGTPCVPQPMCRPYGGGYGGVGGYFWRNAATQGSDPAYALILMGILTCVCNFGE